MPSSLIFTGLVVIWLLILVPAVARHQQEVARPSGASLEGRVLARPRRRRNQGRRIARLLTEEGDVVDPDDLDQDDTPTARETERPWVSTVRAGRGDAPETDEPTDDVAEPEPVVDDADDESGVRWERPPPRYRPGRGGFDPDEDAEKARARYAVRQRIVLTLLVFALLTGVAAAAAFPVVWWAHGAIDLALVVYLIYLRRQVRMEATIRARRAARMAGTRRTLAADDRDLDEWARRGREVTRRPAPAETDDTDPEPEGRPGRAGRRRGGRRLGRRGRRHDTRPRRRRAGRPATRPATGSRRRDRGARERPAPAAARPAAPDPAGDVAGGRGRRRTRPARPRHPGRGAPPARGGGVRG